MTWTRRWRGLRVGGGLRFHHSSQGIDAEIENHLWATPRYGLVFGRGHREGSVVVV
jgi:hypothetical protein